MSKVIWKYLLNPGLNNLELPIGAKVLHVHIQREYHLQLWVQVKQPNGTETRVFHVLTTGQHVPDDMRLNYIGTIHLPTVDLVYHVFEEPDA